MNRAYIGNEVLEDDSWDCEAYGPLGRQVGARCFIAGGAGLRCADQETCAGYMQQERERIWHVIHDGARNGDQTMAYLALAFPTPDSLLNAADGSQDAIAPD